MAITQNVDDYICKANNKIAEISSLATDMLEKTGCKCDISGYVNDILDINSSLFIIDKRWQNIEPTFGYKNFLISLYGNSVDNEVLSLIDKYVIRYDMNDSSSIVYPLMSYSLSGICCGDLAFENINNIVRVVYVNASSLSGTGTIEEQIVEYINENVTISITSLNSKINIVLIDDL